ncbi:MAG: MBL fold metallo-hydrolase [Tatlockia sp.]|nr:MBL fold metallo-hydrolase [Tatlockia sp.]
MELLFLGASSAFSVEKNNYQSNMLLLSKSGKKLLLDCGTDIRHSLHAQNLLSSDIDSVYISHLHSDHSGGLEWLGFSSRFFEASKPNLFISNDLKQMLWDNVLCGGMCSIENEEATLMAFFNVKEIIDGSFSWEEYHFELIKTTHYLSNAQVMPSYGLVITNGIRKIFITTDTRFSPSLMTNFKQYDLIFHDCETAIKSSGQHARFEELITLAPEIKNKIWLYDYNDGDLPDAKAEGFLGFVIPGQRFKL